MSETFKLNKINYIPNWKTQLWGKGKPLYDANGNKKNNNKYLLTRHENDINFMKNKIMIGREHMNNSEEEDSKKIYHQFALCDNVENLFSYIKNINSNKENNKKAHLYEYTTMYHDFHKIRFDVDCDISKLTPELLDYVSSNPLFPKNADVYDIKQFTKFLTFDLYRLIYQNFPTLLVELYELYFLKSK